MVRTADGIVGHGAKCERIIHMGWAIYGSPLGFCLQVGIFQTTFVKLPH